MRTIYAMITCTCEEAREKPGLVPYYLLERATQEVLVSLHGE